MIDMFDVTIDITGLDAEQYDLLLDYLEENHIEHIERNEKRYTVDLRSEEEKYNDWLGNQADEYNDSMR